MEPITAVWVALAVLIFWVWVMGLAISRIVEEVARAHRRLDLTQKLTGVHEWPHDDQDERQT